MNRYFLSFDASGERIPGEAISAYIKSNRFVDKWSFLFPGAYFLKSRYDLKEIDQALTEFLKPTRYVLAKITHDDDIVNGWLNQEIWTWLSENDA